MATSFDRVAFTDEMLLERTRLGDTVAFSVLATRYWRIVHRLAWNMLSDPAAPAQVAEATFISLLRSGDAFPPAVPFRTSLYRVVLGESWRRLRPAPRSAPGGGAGRPVGQRIREALQRLEVLDRAAFLLRAIESLSSEEAGAVLGIAPASIRQRTHRATVMMTAFLGHDERFDQGT
jgi:RNA polymerase sigma-70 factor (ECF subfamily)